MKKIITLVLTFGIFAMSFAQTQKLTKGMYTLTTPSNGSRCSTTQVMDALKAQNPTVFNTHQQQQEQLLQNWITNNYAAFSAQRAIITIPVVVQLWETATSVPDNNVYEQIQTLNEDFRRLNADTGNTPAVFAAVAADCQIEFCLASTDPQGNPTTGIVRQTAGGQPNGVTQLWDATKYLNLYVYNIGGGTLGFTYLPSQAPNNAVHISSNYFGSTGASAPYNLGRTATHEIGHWLNLSHIWGDANCGNDFCADTPTQQTSNGGCPNHPSATCGNNGDMFMNYMDYTNDNCMNTFSADQKARMIAAINAYRPGILTSSATACTASTAIVADFSANQTTIIAGSSINFTDLSTGATTWNWTFTGAATTSSTNQNPTNITYNTTGCYNVTLSITDGNGGSDAITKTCYVNVISATGCDTLNFPLVGTQTLIGSNIWGSISGDNNYLDIAKTNYYTNYAPYTQIDGAYINFSKAHSANGISAITIAIWDNSGTAGTPGTILASQSVNINSIVTGTYTNYSFTSPVTITGNFYLGIQLSGATGDTVAVFTNSDGDTNPSIAWEQWSDNTWHNYSENPASWGVNVEHTIHPIVCTGNSTQPLAATTSSTVENCGNADASASVVASGGNGSYTYSWSNGEVTSSISNIITGTYTVTISDGNTSIVKTITVSANNTSMTAINSSTAANCGQNDGSATVVISGANGTATYLWNNGNTTSAITNVAAGTYTVTITDGTTCSITSSTIVSNNSGFAATASTQSVTCNTDTDGTASAASTGGTPPYSYLWNNGVTTASVSGLAGGSYSVTVNDASGCSFVATAVINEPNAISLSGNTINASSSITSDGSISVAASGGNSSFTYSWSNGQNTSTINNLSVGNYTVTIIDSKGCSATASYTVSIASGIQNNQESYTIKLFPNPTNSIINFSIKSTVSEKVTITIINTIGQIVLTKNITIANGENNFTADLSTNPTGIYFIQLSSKTIHTTERIILK